MCLILPSKAFRCPLDVISFNVRASVLDRSPLVHSWGHLRDEGHTMKLTLDHLCYGTPVNVVWSLHLILVFIAPTRAAKSISDIEDCIVTPAYQGQFTPLPEALCDCIMDLTSQGQSATLESIRTSLSSKFPSMQTPSQEVVYDTLAQLMQERKIYQTSRGYFIVTPERRRSRSRSSSRHHSTEDECSSPRTILMSDQEALHQLYGEITTVRDGAVTHQCVQTNLADVICGGM
ncbi:unnamed protein product [Pieris macdunnoughi]|uniref:Winged helix Storkhead-box1 domain-containing protein n=1 Tax=Pieris macdunnoughi TaxID=345717 RepID=A0A821VA89_9NEOP|nr:unnamed protein product [Pieris macdunnoughi]